jgi:hypothetical protein
MIAMITAITIMLILMLMQHTTIIMITLAIRTLMKLQPLSFVATDLLIQRD